MEYIDLKRNNLNEEHICCAISDKKCTEGYTLKREWLKKETDGGYTFRRLNERAKVFIEYGPAEQAWMPVEAPNYLALGCFWVSGKYKKSGHGKALLQSALDDARIQGKNGLLAVAGKKKNHFMSDGKWLKKQGFTVCDRTENDFELLVLNLENEIEGKLPRFNDSAQKGLCPDNGEYTVYYSNRCPFTEYHINTSLKETAEKRGLKVEIIKLNTLDEARLCPSPATIFSLFYRGKFVTTDLSVCMDSRFDKIIGI